MRAFSLLEVVVVLFLIGILAFTAAPRIQSNHQQLYSAYSILRSHIRYAQMRSLSYGEQYGIRSDSRHSYVMFRTSSASTLPLPGGGTPYLLDESITVTPFSISFDSWGTPYKGEGQESPLASAFTITLSDSEESRKVIINAATGFIE